MKTLTFLIVVIPAVMLLSCVSSKKLKEANLRYSKLDSSYQALQGKLSSCQDSSAKYVNNIKYLNDQMKDQRFYNDEMVNRLKDMSVISNSQAESIKQSLKNISSKDSYIQSLQSAIARKDSLNMALVMNLKGAIGNLDDKDISIKIEKGVIYIDISDKLLFNTGRYQVTPKARDVLGKVAKVLLSRPDIEFMVEGHTDTVPYWQGVLVDNWDLSVKRATSVVRILQKQYGIPPARMTAAGRGEYIPVSTNNTDEGRALNRRTRIMILPQLDQFFKLLERPNNVNANN
jgi:chemotaxis protein MotB